MQPDNGTCGFCHIKPNEYDEIEEATGYRNKLFYGAEENGAIYIQAAGDDDSGYYHPKFCPECGRKLR